MSGKPKLKKNLEELSDAEIFAAIQSLDPGATAEARRENNQLLFVICIGVLVLLLGCAAFVWIYSLAPG